MAALLALAGCAGIPSNGPVQQVGPSTTSQTTGGVGIDPQPPEPGANPELIVAGFLAAMSTFESDFASARLYLTPAAQKMWNPGAGTTIYQSENNKPVTTETTASMNVPVVGRLDVQGRYQASQDRLVHDFGMTRVDGEWRISSPPTGLLIAKYVFDRYYSDLPVHFLTADGTRLAREHVHVHSSELNPTLAVRALLAGPSSWLAPAVTTAIPGDTRMSINAVTVRDGVADVSLTEQIIPLDETQRIRLAAQLTATLDPFDQIWGVRVLANGQPWKVPGQDANGVVTFETFDNFRLLDAETDSAVYGVRGKVLGVIDPTAAERFRPLTGAFGSANWGDAPGQFAVQRNSALVALVNQKRTHLYVAPPAERSVSAAHVGRDLVRPQVLDDGSVWTVDHANGRPALVLVLPTGVVSRIPIPELGTRAVQSFRVSPDRTRMALVVRDGDTAELMMMRVRSTDAVVVDGLRGLPITSSSGLLTTARDVAWSDQDTLLVIAATTSASTFNVYRVKANGASVENLGPSGAGGLPVSLATFPSRQGTAASILTESGEVFRFQGAYRWQRQTGGLSALSMAG